MTGINPSQVVRTRVLLADQPGKHGLGSGYVIAEGIVLTAAHVLEPSNGQPAKEGDSCEVLLWHGTEWYPGRVAWIRLDLDVAAVTCRACRIEEPVHWGTPKGSDPIEWAATGFPRASVDAEGRESEEAYGDFAPLSGATTELALTIRSRQAKPTDTGTSGWAGLSGAAIFSGDHLIGVVVSDPGSYEFSLVGRRVSAFSADDDLAGLLGQKPTLEEVFGGSPKLSLNEQAILRRVEEALASGPGVDLSPHVTIRDQGDEGSCVGMALAVAMEGSLSFQGRPARLSARYGYAKARHLDYPRNWGMDGGAVLETGLKVAQRFGLPLESAWPYVPNQTALPAGMTWKDMDAVRPRYKARLYEINKYEDLPFHLFHGRPIIAGVAIYAEGWYSERAAKTGWVEIPRARSLLGNDAIVIVGYDAAHEALKFANAWGDHWGDRGFGYLPRRVVERCISGFQEQGRDSTADNAAAFWAVEVPLDARHCLEVDVNY